MGLSWVKLKLCFVRVVDEVEVDVKVGVFYQYGWVCIEIML